MCVKMPNVRWRVVFHFCAAAMLQWELRIPLTNIYPWLGLQVYVRLDQPKNAASAYTQGLQQFGQDTSLMAGVARVFEGVGDLSAAVINYKRLLQYDSTNAEVPSFSAVYFSLFSELICAGM